MARPTRAARPGRALLTLFTLLVVLYGVVAAAHFHGTGTLTPKLGLDLEGGDEIVLQPISTGSVSQGTINEAINIIRDRVNGTGISEAQVTSQGGKNIVVDLPGTPSQATKNLVKTSAQLRFRAVIQEAAAGAAADTDRDGHGHLDRRLDRDVDGHARPRGRPHLGWLGHRVDGRPGHPEGAGRRADALRLRHRLLDPHGDRHDPERDGHRRRPPSPPTPVTRTG